jgi:flagellar basal-body rod modification protein FlgD
MAQVKAVEARIFRWLLEFDTTEAKRFVAAHRLTGCRKTQVGGRRGFQPPHRACKINAGFSRGWALFAIFNQNHEFFRSLLNRAGNKQRKERGTMGAMAGLISQMTQMTAGHSAAAGRSIAGGHATATGQGPTAKSANPMAAQANATGSTSTSGSSSATISANDFLSLLVTEMQNQDPTANTDPNEYINQLVQVNSLEQLIDINQNLSTVLGTGSNSSGTGSATGQVAPVGNAATASGAPAIGPVTGPGAGPAATTAPVGLAAHKLGAMSASQAGGSSTAAAVNQFAQRLTNRTAPGNLSVPTAKPASHTVAHALDGHSHARGVPGKSPVSQ